MRDYTCSQHPSNKEYIESQMKNEAEERLVNNLENDLSNERYRAHQLQEELLKAKDRIEVLTEALRASYCLNYNWTQAAKPKHLRKHRDWKETLNIAYRALYPHAAKALKRSYKLLPNTEGTEEDG